MPAPVSQRKETPSEEAARLGERLHRALERLLTLRRPAPSDAICCHGVTHNQWTLLRLLCESGEDGLAMGALASGMGLTPSGLTRCADPLVDRGLVARVEFPRDRRICCLRPTGEGRALWRRITSECAAREGDLLRHTTPAERETIVRGVEMLAALTEEAGKENGPPDRPAFPATGSKRRNHKKDAAR